MESGFGPFRCSIQQSRSSFVRPQDARRSRSRHFNACRQGLYAAFTCRGRILATSLTTFTDEARIALDTLSGRAATLFSPSRAPRRHRPVARRQDRVHLGAGPQPHPWRPAAAVRGAEIRPHRPRLARGAARRRRAALPVRGSHRGAGRAPRLAGLDPRHLRTAADDRIRDRPPAGTACSRSGRLSIDIVDYPGEWLLDLPLLGKDLCGHCRARRSSSPRCRSAPSLSADWRDARRDRRSRRAGRRNDWRAGWRKPSPPICVPASSTSARSPPCRPAAS